MKTLKSLPSNIKVTADNKDGSADGGSDSKPGTGPTVYVRSNSTEGVSGQRPNTQLSVENTGEQDTNSRKHSQLF